MILLVFCSTHAVCCKHILYKRNQIRPLETTCFKLLGQLRHLLDKSLTTVDGFSKQTTQM